MSCGLKELNKENVLSILDSNVRELEHMEKEFEKKATTDADINQLGKVIFALYRVKSIRADIRELEENTTYSSIQIRELLDKINLKYSTDLKLHSKNVIIATTIRDLSNDLSQYDICPTYDDICPSYTFYVFDVDDVLPILKKKVELNDCSGSS